METLTKIIYGAVILLTVSCKKDDLPKATQEGKNIMAAKVNGKTWVKTACWSCIEGGSGLRANYANNILNIVAQQEKDSAKSSIEFLFSVDSPGRYLSTSGFNEINYLSKAGYYETTANTIGEINITKIDKTNKIISGTFSFTAENKDNPNDIITVTDGRFDVTYN
ncbi:DUF6252 family protein [Pedobacter arcticus]|uniref:DUF6252 family protein n=1 Tax=Pedobacter arcticus TaxID=752140 RepID=UPI000314E715|nr:DUF6252 family protein [Pedobacter arcticus]